LKLTEEDVKEFQRIYKEKFNKEISYNDAFKQGTKLINLFKLVIDKYNSQTEEMPI